MSTSDIIAVEQNDGSFKISKFDVHFPKSKSYQNISVFIEGVQMSFQMQLEKNEKICFFKNNLKSFCEGNNIKFPKNFKDVRVRRYLNEQISQKCEEKSKKKSIKEKLKRSLDNKYYPKLLMIPTGDDLVQIVKYIKKRDKKRRYLNIMFCSTIGDFHMESSRIFIYKHSDALVVSDIDGTITNDRIIKPVLKMDPKMFDGVCETFMNIEKRGYKFVYLTQRYMKLGEGTRKYLEFYKQKECSIPVGPILFTQKNVLSAFATFLVHAEAHFKAGALFVIKDLFPRNPFYAGFGNTTRDFTSYEMNNVRLNFLIDKKGKLLCVQKEEKEKKEMNIDSYKSIDVHKLFPKHNNF